MPGVMLIEAMAQASTVLAFKYLQNNDLLHDFFQGGILFTAADQVRFKKVVVPGDQLIIHTKLTRHARKIFEFDVAALVDNITVGHGKLKAVAGISM
jgi:3-hydroxyacyl-[acyl-carrier-protein] dehydratase